MLLARLKSFSFPDGEDILRDVRAIHTTQTGEIRGGPAAAWGRFKAEEVIEATRSSFRWTARIGTMTVVDAYERGNGWLALKFAGVLPVKKITGPEADRGELQRYLASVVLCPAMLLNHSSLQSSEVSPSVLRVSDGNGPPEASVEIEIADDGHMVESRAVRPRISGQQHIMTPWSATVSEYRTIGHMRVPTRLEATWHVPKEPFVYFREELLTFDVLQ